MVLKSRDGACDGVLHSSDYAEDVRVELDVDWIHMSTHSEERMVKVCMVGRRSGERGGIDS